MSVASIVTVPGVRPIVEIGVGSVNETVGVGTWQPAGGGGPVESRWQPAGGTLEGNTWVGRDPYWWDVTCDTLDISTFVGRERATETWDVGTASIMVANSTGWADYPPPDPDQTLLTVRPGRPIRVGVQLAGEPAVYLWGGYIDATAPGYDAEAGETMTFECIDAKGEAGRAFIEKSASPVGAGDLGNVRVGRILNAVAWPSWRRDIDPSSVTLKATSFDAQAVDLMNLAADSSEGVVFGSPAGDVAYRPRDWQAFTADDPVDGTIGNFGIGPAEHHLVEDPAGSGLYDPGGLFAVDPPGSFLLELVDPAYELVESPKGSRLFLVALDTAAACPSIWELSFAREDISTKVIVSRFDDATSTPVIPPVIREDVTARTYFGTETFERTDLETELAFDLENLADRILDARSYRYMPRIAAVTLDAATAPGVAEVLAAADPFKPARFYCRHRAADGREAFSRTMMVVGVEHTITPETWTARIALDDARPFTTQAVGRWSDGVADTSGWNESTWSRTV